MVKICEPGGEALFLPSPGITEFPDYALGAMFGVLLVYMFLGIAIVSDIFMGSIEAVTSWKWKVKRGDRRRTELLWNETIATLTLMALGSSAPEIFLATIETFKREFHAGPLGPSTIIGSASFNLFVIIAVCMACIPAGEIRAIANVRAFLVTALFSLCAYLWMVFALVIHGADVIDIVEAILTFVFLPLLVWVSYSVDVGYLGALCDRIFGKEEEEEEKPDYELHKIGFRSDMQSVDWSAGKQSIEVTVVRKGGLTKEVSCTYHTERLTAVPGYDYEEATGLLEFPSNTKEATLHLSIMPRAQDAATRDFLLILEEANDGADFDPDDDGGKESAILTVTLLQNDEVFSPASRMIDRAINSNGIIYATHEWVDQFSSAIYCNGSAEEQAEASLMDWCLHVLAFPWKLAFALLPPTSYCGGWLCFVCSIGMIGVLTGFVSDLAEMFGCALDIPDIVTAITFVALGTSMPDLFASLSAAKADPTADASIVNVTGSNAVNVFLGLGVPWTVSALHWASAERTADWESRYPEIASDPKYDGMTVFVVESRNLGFSVLVFSGFCSVAIFLLVYRRKVLGYELGGHLWHKLSSAFLLLVLWSGFVCLTCWRVLRCEGAKEGDFCKAPVREQGMVIGTVLLVTLCAALWPVFCIWQSRDVPVDSTKPQALIAWLSKSPPVEGQLPETELGKKMADCMDVKLSVRGDDHLRSGASLAGDREPSCGEFEPEEEATPCGQGSQLLFLSLGAGVTHRMEHKKTPSVVGMVSPMGTTLPSTHARTNVVVAVIVVAYHSTGRNETVYHVKPLMPFGRLMEEWCKYHKLPKKKTSFWIKERLIKPEDTPASLGHLPGRSTMVVHAKPQLSNGDSNGSMQFSNRDSSSGSSVNSAVKPVSVGTR